MAAKVATMRQSPEQTQRGRTLREAQTEAESLLWSLLRTKQLCHMKFRRQHPIGPFFADFACESQKLVVELDGDYHAHVQENDLRRQQYLAGKGWNVIRFTNEVVLRDVEGVLRAIAAHLEIPFSFQKRTPKRSGMMSQNNQSETREATNQIDESPPPGRYRVRPPRGEVKMCRYQCPRGG